MNLETGWDSESICLRSDGLDVRTIAGIVYRLTCRTDFSEPGFCILNLGNGIDSRRCRQYMVDLKNSMAKIHELQFKKTLTYLSAARFDQQETTRPHLDGGPDECFLMLGYEPSDVEAELEISDYAKCAFDKEISPREFLRRHNPMFQAERELLRSYTTRIPCFSHNDFQIICINNSSLPFDPDKSNWQGTLHTATILTPDDTKRRVINATMIAFLTCRDCRCDHSCTAARICLELHRTKARLRQNAFGR